VREPGIQRWLWRAVTLAIVLAVALVIPALLLIKPDTSWLLVLVPLLLALQAWSMPAARREILALSPLNPALLLLTVMLLVSLWASPDLTISLPKISGLLLGFLLFFTILRYTPNRSAWSAALISYIAAGAGAALLGLVGTRWFTFKLTALNDLTGRLPQLVQGVPGAEAGIHPNILAGTLLWVLPVAAFSALAMARYPVWFLQGEQSKAQPGKRRQARLVSAGALVVSVAALLMAGVLVLAQSRSAYLAAGLTAGCLVLVLLPRWARNPALALGAVALAGGLLWTSQLGWENLLAALVDNLSAGGGAVSTVSFTQRLEIWSRAQWAIRDVPLTGLGMDIFRLALPMLYPLLEFNPDAPITHAHNELLQAALDLGLPGLVAFLALNLGAFTMLARLLREEGPVRLLALGLYGGLLAHFLFGLTDAISLGSRPAFFFWILLALIAGLYRQIVIHPRLGGLGTSGDRGTSNGTEGIQA
jgi:putative inorganic carbon (hco3(-)) transporter